MDKLSTQRLPPLKRNWWLKHRFLKLYMLREATVLPLLFSRCVYWPVWWRFFKGQKAGRGGSPLWAHPLCCY